MSWTSRRLVVRVRGRTREVEVALPGDRSVSALLPGLVAMVESLPQPSAAEAGEWRLVTADGRELPLQQSLTALGVRDGSALRLRVNGEEEHAAASPESQEQAVTEARMRRCLTVAVVSPKGGVGKTTATMLLGAALAHLRSERVIAVDADPDYGTLGLGLAPERPMSVDELAELLDQPALTPAMLDRCLIRARSGLRVLPAPAVPERMDALDRDTYRRVLERLRDTAGFLLLDCGAGMRAPATRAALEAADQVVMVTDADPATMKLVASAASHLPRSTYRIVLINKVPAHGFDRERAWAMFRSARAVIEIPADARTAPKIAAGDFNWSTAGARWRSSARAMAAALSEAWIDLRVARPASTWGGGS
jgi:MinD-like ATPase involved in chromosome partitioning or flagellar assembly